MKLFVVIRGAKERTEDKCVAIAKELVGADNVVLLNEPSFAEAHIKSMEIGASLKGYDYVIFLDADILLIQDNFFEIFEKGINRLNDKNFYKFNFRVFDRQCKTPVYAGVHIYNIPVLKKALGFKHVAIGAQRPETEVAKYMAKKGYKTYIAQEIIGFHGYEQAYIDMYRTAFVRGVKYKGHWDFYLSTFYKNKALHDDYLWSYLGLIDGIMSFAEGHTNASLSKQNYTEAYKAHLSRLNYSEKAPLDISQPLPILEQEMTDINPLFSNNKGWLSPQKVGFNETNETKKLIRRIYKKVKRKLKL